MSLPSQSATDLNRYLLHPCPTGSAVLGDKSIPTASLQELRCGCRSQEEHRRDKHFGERLRDLTLSLLKTTGRGLSSTPFQMPLSQPMLQEVVCPSLPLSGHVTGLILTVPWGSGSLIEFRHSAPSQRRSRTPISESHQQPLHQGGREALPLRCSYIWGGAQQLEPHHGTF